MCRGQLEPEALSSAFPFRPARCHTEPHASSGGTGSPLMLSALLWTLLHRNTSETRLERLTGLVCMLGYGISHLSREEETPENFPRETAVILGTEASAVSLCSLTGGTRAPGTAGP